jgi:hypothetical protein
MRDLIAALKNARDLMRAASRVSVIQPKRQSTHILRLLDGDIFGAAPNDDVQVATSLAERSEVAFCTPAEHPNLSSVMPYFGCNIAMTGRQTGDNRPLDRCCPRAFGPSFAQAHA